MPMAPEHTAFCIAAAVICFLIVVAVILIVRHDRKRIRIDPMMAAHGEYPGFSREQLSRFQSAVHDERLPKSGGGR